MECIRVSFDHYLIAKWPKFLAEVKKKGLFLKAATYEDENENLGEILSNPDVFVDVVDRIPEAATFPDQIAMLSETLKIDEFQVENNIITITADLGRDKDYKITDYSTFPLCFNIQINEKPSSLPEAHTALKIFLSNHPGFTEVVLSCYSVTCINIATKSLCVFNFEQPPLSPVEILKSYLNINEKVRSLIQLVDFWAHRYKLRESDGFNTFSLYLLVIFFLQQPPFNFPPIRQFYKLRLVKMAPLENITILQLVEKFFAFYGKIDYLTNRISPGFGYSYEKGKDSLKKNLNWPVEVDGFFIQDPLDQYSNVCESTSLENSAKFSALCRTAVKDLKLNSNLSSLLSLKTLSGNFEVEKHHKEALEVFKSNVENYILSLLTYVVGCQMVSVTSTDTHTIYSCKHPLGIWDKRLERVPHHLLGGYSGEVHKEAVRTKIILGSTNDPVYKDLKVVLKFENDRVECRLQTETEKLHLSHVIYTKLMALLTTANSHLMPSWCKSPFKLKDDAIDLLKDGASFNEQISVLVDNLKDQDRETNVNLIVSHLSSAMGLMSTGITMFGSTVSGLSTPSSTLDICVHLSTQFKLKSMDLVPFVQNSGFFSVKRVTHLLECVHLPTDIICIIHTTDGTRLAESSNFIHYYSTLHKKIYQLMMFVRLWKVCAQLQDFPKHALDLMVIFFLQQQPYNIPAGKDICTTKSDFTSLEKATMFELVEGFFRFYSTFDYFLYIISPFSGRAVPKYRFEMPVVGPWLTIQDPVMFSRNVSESFGEGFLGLLVLKCKHALEIMKRGELDLLRPLLEQHHSDKLVFEILKESDLEDDAWQEEVIQTLRRIVTELMLGKMQQIRSDNKSIPYRVAYNYGFRCEHLEFQSILSHFRPNESFSEWAKDKALLPHILGRSGMDVQTIALTFEKHPSRVIFHFVVKLDFRFAHFHLIYTRMLKFLTKSSTELELTTTNNERNEILPTEPKETPPTRKENNIWNELCQVPTTEPVEKPPRNKKEIKQAKRQMKRNRKKMSAIQKIVGQNQWTTEVIAVNQSPSASQNLVLKAAETLVNESEKVESLSNQLNQLPMDCESEESLTNLDSHKHLVKKVLKTEETLVSNNLMIVESEKVQSLTNQLNQLPMDCECETSLTNLDSHKHLVKKVLKTGVPNNLVIVESEKVESVINQLNPMDCESEKAFTNVKSHDQVAICEDQVTVCDSSSETEKAPKSEKATTNSLSSMSKEVISKTQEGLKNSEKTLINDANLKNQVVKKNEASAETEKSKNSENDSNEVVTPEKESVPRPAISTNQEKNLKIINIESQKVEPTNEVIVIDLTENSRETEKIQSENKVIPTEISFESSLLNKDKPQVSSFLETFHKQRISHKNKLKLIEKDVISLLPNSVYHSFDPTALELNPQNDLVQVHLQTKSDLSDIYIKLNRCSKFQKVLVVKTDHRVQFTHVKTKMTVFIDLKTSMAFQNAKLVKYYLDLDERVLTSTLIIKTWSDSNKQFSEHLIVIMMIFYLQQKYKLPCVVDLQIKVPLMIEGWDCAFTNIKSANLPQEVTVLEIVKGFFEFYGDFDYFSFVIAPFFGSPIAKTRFLLPYTLPESYKTYIKKHCELEVDAAICVQDPFVHSKNISADQSYQAVSDFAALCRHALKIVETPENGFGGLFTGQHPKFAFSRFSISCPSEENEEKWMESVKSLVYRMSTKVLGSTNTQIVHGSETSFYCNVPSNILLGRVRILKGALKQMLRKTSAIDKEIAVTAKMRLDHKTLWTMSISVQFDKDSRSVLVRLLGTEVRQIGQFIYTRLVKFLNCEASRSSMTSAVLPKDSKPSTSSTIVKKDNKPPSTLSVNQKDCKSTTAHVLKKDTPSSTISSGLQKDKPSMTSSVLKKDSLSTTSDLRKDSKDFKPPPISSVQKDSGPSSTTSVQKVSGQSSITSVQKDSGLSTTSSIPKKDNKSSTAPVLEKATPSITSSSVQKDSGPSPITSVPKDCGPSTTSSVPKKDSKLLSISSALQKDSKSSTVSVLEKDTPSSTSSSVQKGSGPSPITSIQKDSGQSPITSVQKDSGPSTTSSVHKKDSKSSTVLVLEKDTPSSTSSSVQKDSGPSSVTSIQKGSGQSPNTFVQKDSGPSTTPCVPKKDSKLLSISSALQKDRKSSTAPVLEKDTPSSTSSFVQKDSGPSPITSIQKDSGQSPITSVQKGSGPSTTSSVHKKDSKLSTVLVLEKDSPSSTSSSVQKDNGPSLITSIQKGSGQSPISPVQKDSRPSTTSSALQKDSKSSTAPVLKKDTLSSTISSVLQKDRPSMTSVQKNSGATTTSSVQKDSGPSPITSVQKNSGPSTTSSVPTKDSKLPSISSDFQKDSKSSTSTAPVEKNTPPSTSSSVQKDSGPFSMTSIQKGSGQSPIPSVQKARKSSIALFLKKDALSSTISPVLQKDRPSITSVQKGSGPSAITSVQEASGQAPTTSVQKESKQSLITSVQKDGGPSTISSVLHKESGASPISSLQKDNGQSSISSVQKANAHSQISSTLQKDTQVSQVATAKRKSNDSVISTESKKQKVEASTSVAVATTSGKTTPKQGLLNLKKMDILSTTKTKPHFQDQVTHFCENLLYHPPLMKEILRTIHNDLHSVLSRFFIFEKIQFFGSAVTGLFIGETNVEINFENLRPHPISNRQTFTVTHTLRESDKFGIVETSASGAVRFKHIETDLECILHFKNKLRVCSTLLLDYYLSLDDKLRHLVLVIKTCVGMFRRPEKWSTHSLYWMIIFYLEQPPYNLPPVAELQKNVPEDLINGWNTAFEAIPFKSEALKNATLKDLMAGFFKFYAEFDYFSYVIAPFFGSPIEKIRFCPPLDLPVCYQELQKRATTVTKKIFVQDPFEHSKDTTHRVTSFGVTRFASSCRDAYQRLNYYGQTNMLYDLVTQASSNPMVRIFNIRRDTHITVYEWLENIRNAIFFVATKILCCRVAKNVWQVNSKLSVIFKGTRNMMENRIAILKANLMKLPPGASQFEKDVFVSNVIMKESEAVTTWSFCIDMVVKQSDCVQMVIRVKQETQNLIHFFYTRLVRVLEHGIPQGIADVDYGTPSPMGFNCVTPSPMGVNCVTPSPMGVNYIVPSQNEVNYVSPTQIGVNYGTPSQMGVHHVTPDQMGINNVILGQHCVNNVFPSQMGVNQVVPSQSDVNYLIPGPHGVNNGFPSQIGVNYLTPTQNCVNYVPSYQTGVNYVPPDQHGVNYAVPNQNGVNYVTPTQNPVNYVTPTQNPVNYVTSTQNPVNYVTPTQNPVNYVTPTQNRVNYVAPSESANNITIKQVELAVPPVSRSFKILVTGSFNSSNVISVHEHFSNFGKVTNLRILGDDRNLAVEYCFAELSVYLEVVQQEHAHLDRRLKVVPLTPLEHHVPYANFKDPRLAAIHRGITDPTFTEQLNTLWTHFTNYSIQLTIKNQRKKILEDFTTALTSLFRHKQLTIEPNVMDLNFELDHSDLFIYNVEPQRFVHIKDLLSKNRNFRDVVLLDGTNPVVSCLHNSTRTSCSLRTQNSLNNTHQLVRYYLNLDGKLRKFLMMIKFWMQWYDLVGLESFSNKTIELMVIFFLQQAPYNLPSVKNLQESTTAIEVDGWNIAYSAIVDFTSTTLEESSLLDLVVGFFQYYSNFDYISYVVSPYCGTAVPKVSFLKPYKLPESFKKYVSFDKELEMTSGFCVQDFFDHSRNLSASVPLEVAGTFTNLCRRSLQAIQPDQKLLLYGLLLSTHTHRYDYPEFTIVKSQKKNLDEWVETVESLTLVLLTEVLGYSVSKIPGSEPNKFGYECVGQHNVWEKRIQSDKKLVSDVGGVQREINVSEEVVRSFPQKISWSLFLKLEFLSDPSRVRVCFIRKPGCRNVFHVCHFLYTRLVGSGENEVMFVKNRKSNSEIVPDPTDTIDLTTPEHETSDEAPSLKPKHSDQENDEEDDIPSDFFDDFSDENFLNGLDISDSWDTDSTEKKSKEEPKRKSEEKSSRKSSRKKRNRSRSRRRDKKHEKRDKIKRRRRSTSSNERKSLRSRSRRSTSSSERRSLRSRSRRSTSSERRPRRSRSRSRSFSRSRRRRDRSSSREARVISGLSSRTERLLKEIRDKINGVEPTYGTSMGYYHTPPPPPPAIIRAVPPPSQHMHHHFMGVNPMVLPCPVPPPQLHQPMNCVPPPRLQQPSNVGTPTPISSGFANLGNATVSHPPWNLDNVQKKISILSRCCDILNIMGRDLNSQFVRRPPPEPTTPQKLYQSPLKRSIIRFSFTSRQMNKDDFTESLNKIVQKIGIMADCGHNEAEDVADRVTKAIRTHSSGTKESVKNVVKETLGISCNRPKPETSAATLFLEKMKKTLKDLNK